MTLDDESLLTAYLDGELDPDQRSSIESALLADPELAEQLRRLAAIRELVAGLPRPVLTVDLAGAVEPCGSAARPTLMSLARWPLPRLRSAAVLGGLGLAATVLVALSIALRATGPKRVHGPRLPVPAVVSTPEDRQAGSRPPTATGVPASRATATAVASLAAPSPASGTDPGGPSRNPEDAAAADQRLREAEKIREMLDSPNLTRTFIVLDVLGGSARDRIEELVQKTPRTEAAYGRITVSQGIVIDPRHPNEATVFALVMNEQELGHFQKKLKQSFPDRVDDVAADPAMVTQLADIGQVAVLPGSRAAEVVIPTEVSPRIAALRTDKDPSGTHLERHQISPDFDVSESVGIGNLAVPGERGVMEKAEGPGKLAASTNAGGERLTLARKDDRRSATGAADEAAPGAAGKPPVSAGPLADAFLKAPDLNQVPAIVLVWVTTP